MGTQCYTEKTQEMPNPEVGWGLTRTRSSYVPANAKLDLRFVRSVSGNHPATRISDDAVRGHMALNLGRALTLQPLPESRLALAAHILVRMLSGNGAHRN